MHADELIHQAQQRTGLRDFDGDTFRAPLEFMLRCIDRREERDRIHQALDEEMVNALANRLRVSDWLREHPELEDAPIERPVIVMGMPRTGTTAVSYLLGCDPRFRSLLNWEAVDSVPPPTTATLKSDPRCVEKKQLQEKILPNLPFSTPHWEWADGPTECIFVQAQDFKALSWESRIASRDYSEFMLHCDMSTAYDYQKKVMRVLQSQAPGRWALKMPSHALHFTWALRAFPDARFVWTHRDPFETLASFGNMTTISHTVALGHIDERFIHDMAPRQLAEHADRPMRLRASLPVDTIFDVYCAELMRDPIPVMRDLYAWLGEELDDEVEKAMRAWLEEDSRRQSTRPKYGLDDFGWTRAGVAPYFEEYLTRYPRAKGA